MYDKRMDLYDATKFENIRGIIRNSIDLHPDNIAFIIKETEGKVTVSLENEAGVPYAAVEFLEER